MTRQQNASSLLLGKRLIGLLLVAYIVALQIPLLSPFRVADADEMLLVDASYGMASGDSPVPAGPIWSHVLPETGRYFAAYPPLYLYAQSTALSVLGFSPIAVGLLHVVFRLIGATLVWLICRKLQSGFVALVFAAIWATFAVGPVGRYEDLALVFVLTATLLVVDGRWIDTKAWLIGLPIGLTLLTYSAPLAVVVPFGIIALFWFQDHSLDKVTLKILAIKYAIIGVTAALIASTWLLWIVPYWAEFKAHFLEFAAPDALTRSYISSLGDFLNYSLFGFRTSPIPLHYSLLPLIITFIVLLFFDVRRNRPSLPALICFLMPAVVMFMTANVRIHKTYNMIWFIASLLLLIPVLWHRVFVMRREGENAPARPPVVFVYGFGLVLGLQMLATAGMIGLALVGNSAAVSACGTNPHQGLINLIPQGDRVISNNGLVFYSVREQNPVYWPAGLDGITPGGISFTSTYDDSFRWLVTSQPLSDESVDLGGKFAWNEATQAYYRMHYQLVAATVLSESCGLLHGLSRYSEMLNAIYLYQRAP